MMGALSGLGNHIASAPEVEALAEAFGFVRSVPKRREVEDRKSERAEPERAKKKPKKVWREESSEDVIDLEKGADGTYKEKKR